MHQTYDPRLRNAIARSGNPNLFSKLSFAHSLCEMSVSSRYALRQAKDTARPLPRRTETYLEEVKHSGRFESQIESPDKF